MGTSAAFRHEGLAYHGLPDLTKQLAAFISDGLLADEPVLVLETPAVIQALSLSLGPDAESVAFVDVHEVGRNPACIMPIWHDFLHRHRGRPIRGVGEQLWPGRSEAEAAECHLHEALLGQVLADQPAWILCPYDVELLDPRDIDSMRRVHTAELDLRDALRSPLPEPTWAEPAVWFGPTDLATVRWIAESHARAAGFSPARCDDVAIVISELATNSIRYGGGGGTLRCWVDDDRVVYEIHDAGHVGDPSVGRQLPSVHQPGGRGLWLVNHLSDLVQLRTCGDTGTTIRVALGPA